MRKSLRKYLKWDHDSGNDDDNINGKSYFFSCSPGTNTSLSLATLSPWFTHSEFRIFISVDINHHLPRIYLILIAFWVLLENINHLHFFSCRLISYKRKWNRWHVLSFYSTHNVNQEIYVIRSSNMILKSKSKNDTKRNNNQSASHINRLIRNIDIQSIADVKTHFN